MGATAVTGGGAALGVSVAVVVIVIIAIVVWLVMGMKKCPSGKSDCTVWPFKYCGANGRCTASNPSTGSGDGTTCSPECAAPQVCIQGTCQTPPASCTPNPCMNGGTCSMSGSTPTCSCPPGGWTGTYCTSPLGCNTAGTGTAADMWCAGMAGGATSTQNPTTCDSVTGACTNCSGDYALGPTGQCDQCTDPSDAYNNTNGTCNPAGTGSGVGCDAGYPSDGGNGNCQGGLYQNTSTCSNTGTCVCVAPYAPATGGAGYSPCTACATGYTMTTFAGGAQGCVPTNSMCGQAVGTFTCTAANGSSLSCPPGSIYTSQQPPVYAMFGETWAGPGCYQASATPAIAVTTDCYPSSENSDYASWTDSDNAGFDQACRCEFGAGASYAGAVDASAGTKWCSTVLGRNHTNVLECNVPYPVPNNAPDSPVPTNPLDGAYTAVDRGGYGQAGAETQTNPGQQGAGSPYDYAIWNDSYDASAGGNSGRCNSTCCGGPYTPGWGWYQPTSSYWMQATKSPYGPFGPPANQWTPPSS